MTISKQALELIGCTVEDYLQWCKDNGFVRQRQMVGDFLGDMKISYC